MWQYEQSTGNLSHNGVLVGTGYSGNGPALDNPDLDNEQDHGPIPKGTYTIGPFFDDPPSPTSKGPVVAHLYPDTSNQMYGRSGFMIHGDNRAMNHTASDGCIILAKVIREQIASSGDVNLAVTP
jgi:hypothetical protein